MSHLSEPYDSKRLKTSYSPESKIFHTHDEADLVIVYKIITFKEVNTQIFYYVI